MNLRCDDVSLIISNLMTKKKFESWFQLGDKLKQMIRMVMKIKVNFLFLAIQSFSHSLFLRSQDKWVICLKLMFYLTFKINCVKYIMLNAKISKIQKKVDEKLHFLEFLTTAVTFSF